MTFTDIFGWVVCGLIVGIAARIIVPGRDSIELAPTIVLGIAGAVVGGLLYWLLQSWSGGALALPSGAWPGWILSILGGALLLWVYTLKAPRSWWQ